MGYIVALTLILTFSMLGMARIAFCNPGIHNLQGVNYGI